MPDNLLLQQFNSLAEAPDAPAKLHEFILQLAIRGHIVAQNNQDAPAMGAAEEARKLAQADLPAITEESYPFALPQGWSWLRIGEAMRLINGRAFKPSEWSTSGLPIVRIQNLNDPTAPFNYCNFGVPEKVHIKDGDFLISWSGTPGTSFGAFIWDRGHAILNQHIFRAELIGSAYDKRFLRLAVNGRLDEMIAKAHGGVGLQHITKGKLELLVLPVPPLAEQRHIVEKVEQLLALCDQLEARQTTATEHRTRLVHSALDHLTAAKDEIEFRRHAQLVVREFHALGATAELIPVLRDGLIDLGASGGFTADVSGWRESRLGDIADLRLGKMLDKAKNKGRPLPYLRNTNVQWFKFDLSNIKEMRFEEDELREFTLRKGDLLVCEGGEPGRCAVWGDELPQMMFQKAIHRVRPNSSLLPAFLAYRLRADAALGRLESYFTGATIKHFTGQELNRYVFLLPPLAEQKRIVAKVEELMRWCDQLETHFATARTAGAHLLDAALRQFLERTPAGNPQGCQTVAGGRRGSGAATSVQNPRTRMHPAGVPEPHS